MPDQPNKPAGEKDTPVADRQAVRNQGEVKPEDYPERHEGSVVQPK